MQNTRPVLSELRDSETFRQYYYLKEELTAYLRGHGLPTSGSKAELTERVAAYLDGVDIPAPAKQTRARVTSAPDILITPDTPIEPGIVCSQRHRAFFTEHIGKWFSFSTAFQQWLKEHPGVPYADAIDAWHQLDAARKQAKGQSEIAGQFEYNTYIRAFFAANPGKPLSDAIACWRQKKARPGHNRYEPGDLACLDSDT